MSVNDIDDEEDVHDKVFAMVGSGDDKLGLLDE